MVVTKPLQIEKTEGLIMEQELGGTAKILRHKEVEIFIVDLSGMRGRELAETMRESAKAAIPEEFLPDE